MRTLRYNNLPKVTQLIKKKKRNLLNPEFPSLVWLYDILCIESFFISYRFKDSIQLSLWVKVFQEGGLEVIGTYKQRWELSFPVEGSSAPRGPPGVEAWYSVGCGTVGVRDPR